MYYISIVFGTFFLGFSSKLTLSLLVLHRYPHSQSLALFVLATNLCVRVCLYFNVYVYSICVCVCVLRAGTAKAFDLNR